MTELKIGDTISFEGHEYVILSAEAYVNQEQRRLKIEAHDALSMQRFVDEVRARRQMMPKLEKIIDKEE